MAARTGKSLEFWKQFLLFSAPSLTALTLIFAVFFGIQRSTNITALQHSDQISVDFAKTVLNNHFVGTGEDLLFLADINDFEQTSNDKWYQSPNTTHDLLEFLASKSRYSHISILNNIGIPLIQINNEGGAISVTANPTNNLEEVEYLSLLKKGDIYTSPMSLRSDINGIMLPKQPTISFVTPLVDNSGDIRGFLEIGLRVQNLVNDFRRMGSSVGNHLYLIDDNGFWLIHPNVSKEFGFISTSGARFSTEFPEEWTSMNQSTSGQMTTDEGIFSYTTLAPTEIVAQSVNHYSWKLLAYTTHGTIIGALQKLAIQLLNIYLVMVIILIIICVRLAVDRMSRISVRASLSESEQLNRSVVQTSANAIVSIDHHGLVLNCNPSALALFQRTEGDVLGFKFERTFISAVQQERFVAFLSTADELPVGSHSEPADFDAFDIHGYTIPVTITVSVDQWKGERLITAFITDNRERMQSLELQRLTEVVFRATTEGITVTDANNNIEAVNPAFSTITGYTEAEVLKKNPRLLRSGQHDSAFYKEMWGILHSKGIWKGEIWNRKKSGEIYPEEISLALVRNDAGKVLHHIAIFHDITSRKSQEQKISHQAHYDQLTELPNRYVFIDHLDREIQNFKRYGVGFALLFIDLNRFKDINDNFGHRTGDIVLQEAANRLKESVRESDMVARLAGDEFTVVVRSVHNNQDLVRLIAKVKAGLDGPLVVGDHEVNLSGAIGGVIYSPDMGGADDLLNAADEAMYETKKHDELHGITPPSDDVAGDQ
jgi:diguanylate cyclase (GGDEF)-like protein/PAS domain S-box-containing protein